MNKYEYIGLRPMLIHIVALPLIVLKGRPVLAQGA